VFEDSFNGLRSGRAAQMAVVGLATTNKAEDIASFSDMQIFDYQSVSFLLFERLLNSI
jgi:beta-phosphoglucomutase-like phosphatase (HAD superfamily)